MDAIRKIERGLGLIETALLVVILSSMIFLAFFQVILRDIFHSGILWADPLLRHLVVWLGFLGAAFAAAQGKHFAWEMPKPKNKNLAVALNVVANLVGAAIAFQLALAARQYEIEERTFGHALFRIGSLKVPSWISAEIIVIGFALIGVHLIFRSVLNNHELDNI